MSYDAIVIGGGSGGSAFSKRAAGYGAKVALIERGAQWDEAGAKRKRLSAGPGGTCVNVGCVPKKLMFMAAAHREMMVGPAATAQGYGVHVPAGAGHIDWKTLKERRDKYVAKLNTGYSAGWKKEGVEVIEGIGTFVDSETVAVQCNDGTSRTLKGKHILIACGGLPSEPDIPGVEHAINSDGFFELEEQPKKVDLRAIDGLQVHQQHAHTVAVVGAGYIAVEMAGILHAMGSETHLFFRGDTVLRRGFDPFLVETLMEAMEHHGPVLHRNSTPHSITKQENGLLTYTATEGPMGEVKAIADFDCILLAIGRKPVTDQIGLQNTTVELNKSGHIVVDQFENTNVPGVYAIGDITSTGYELTPVAIAAGRRLADRLFLGEGRARIAYEMIATVVFSHPPIGCIGLTEPQAKAEFGEANVRVKQSRFNSMLYAFNDDDKKVKTGLKLVLKLPEEKVVGLHCIGPYSDEMMQGFAVAVRMGATRADFEASVAIHPTISEEFVTFGGWGQDRSGDQVKAQLPPYLNAS